MVGGLYLVNSCQRMVGNRDHESVTCFAFRQGFTVDVKDNDESEMNDLTGVDSSYINGFVLKRSYKI